MTAVRTAMPRVAYQGEPGAYGELAIMRQWGGEATPVSATTFPETLSLLGRGGADYAVIPVWNSTIGEILDTTLLLTHHASRLETIAELTVPVVHCLLGLPGTSLGAVRYVGSHPTALAQCRALFGSRRQLQPCVAHDTAGAARELAALGGLGSLASPSSRAGTPTWFEPYRPVEPTALAVIAGAGVARLYGLTVLVDGVQDNPANATRFVVVRAQDGAHW